MSNLLTLDAIRTACPSVFAAEAGPKTSKHYRFIPTSHAVEALMDSGFVCSKAAKMKVRNAEKSGFAKHMLRFRMKGVEQIGEVVPEILLRNAHDGTSAYRMDAGLFRFICENGLVIAEAMYGSIRIRHSGTAVRDIVEESKRVIEVAQAAAVSAQKWAQIEMTAERIMSFASEAAAIRFGDDAERVQSHSLIRAKRSEDVPNSLWHVFNRVQENAVEGGVRLAPAAGSLTGRRSRSRAMTSIDESVSVNKRLWALADQYAQAA